MNLENICQQVIELTQTVGEFINHERKSNSQLKVEIKGLHDFVTYVDKTSEEKLVDELKNILPEAGFIAEEGTTTFKGETYNWVIDPLDGTTNYIHGITPYAISIALMKDNKVILGVVRELGLNECFYAWENSKAYLDGKEINVSKTESIKDSFIATYGKFAWSSKIRLSSHRFSLCSLRTFRNIL